ncbi:MAG TPA: hypothetical protein VK168_01835 [Saprospiraceae bacterium]|nr:hypothetical protein [Saprospiraceae bacterium]
MRQPVLLIVCPNARIHHTLLKKVTTQERYLFKNEAYLLGKLKGLYHEFQLVLQEPGRRNTNLRIATKQAIQLFSPHYVFLLDTANGIGNLNPGDVAVANRLWTRASSKSTQGKWVECHTNEVLKKLLLSSNTSKDSLKWATLTSDEHFKAPNTDPNFWAMSKEAEQFMTIMEDESDVFSLSFLGIKPEVGAAESSLKKSIENLTNHALLTWTNFECKDLIADSLHSQKLAQDILTSLFPFPEAVKEVEHDFAYGFNKAYQNVWNYVKPLLAEEFHAYRQNPRDWDYRTNVRDTLKKNIQYRKEVVQTLDQLLKHARFERAAISRKVS